MALIVFDDDRKKMFSAKTASEMWRVWKREKRGSAEQRAFVKHIKDIHLNPNDPSTPQSYIKEKQVVLIDMGMLPAPEPERQEPWWYR